MRLNYESIKGKRGKKSRFLLLVATLYAERTRTRINHDSERTKEITKTKSAYLKNKYVAAQLIFF